MSDIDFSDVPRLNSGTLAMLAGIMGSADRQRLFDDFVGSLHHHLDLLKAAVDPRDLQQVKFAAHTLKGNAANIGADRLHHMCKRISDQPDVADLSERVPVIEAEAEASLAALRQSFLGQG